MLNAFCMASGLSITQSHTVSLISKEHKWNQIKNNTYQSKLKLHKFTRQPLRHDFYLVSLLPQHITIHWTYKYPWYVFNTCTQLARNMVHGRGSNTWGKQNWKKNCSHKNHAYGTWRHYSRVEVYRKKTCKYQIQACWLQRQLQNHLETVAKVDLGHFLLFTLIFKTETQEHQPEH